MFFRAILYTVLAIFLACTPAKAGQNKYASIIIDADSLEILHARKIDEARYPASLAKMMTLYLAFDALERRQIHMNDKMIVSRRAQNTAPIKLGLRAGTTITVDQAIQALTVRSANDAAIVLAEYIGGSEGEFARSMSEKARQLGMIRTRFINAHGLPNQAQTTTARDMAKLASALLQNHRRYYPYFSQKSFTYKGRLYHNHNSLLGTVEGVDGFKTGYTNASGYNIVLSAKRNNRRIIAVVLGGASNDSRDKHMADLLERGFNVIKKNEARKAVQYALNADLKPTPIVRKTEPVPSIPLPNIPLPNIPLPSINAYTLRAGHNNLLKTIPTTVRIIEGANGMHIPQTPPTTGWAIQIGAFSNAEAAQTANFMAKGDVALELAAALSQIIPVQRKNGLIYRARLGELTAKHAQETCKTLAQRRQVCLVISPS
ncbi:MAG: D-alanyl-D-alanine carboxypeptidase [Robiginitomaculum sp.]